QAAAVNDEAACPRSLNAFGRFASVPFGAERGGCARYSVSVRVAAAADRGVAPSAATAVAAFAGAVPVFAAPVAGVADWRSAPGASAPADTPFVAAVAPSPPPSAIPVPVSAVAPGPVPDASP